MTRVAPLPALAWEFGMITLAERLSWHNALSCHILAKMDLPEWKRQEQVEPMNLTITCLVDGGMNDPDAISKHLLSYKTTK